MKIRSFFLFLLVTIAISCDKKDQKFQQYYSNGQMLYLSKCVNCHGQDGEGLAGLYPPLKASDYIKDNLGAAICGIKYGMEGKIIVNGKTYDQAMPANTDINEIQLAYLMTFINNSWNNTKTIFEKSTVDSLLMQCSKK